MSHPANISKMRISALREIYLAQSCSDWGKGIHCIPDFPGYLDEYISGYQGKDTHIRRALRICMSSNVGIIADVQTGFDQHGKPCYIVYFKIHGMGAGPNQVSFHSFDPKLKEFKGLGKPQHWQKSETSREVCRKIYNSIVGKPCDAPSL